MVRKTSSLIMLTYCFILILIPNIVFSAKNLVFDDAGLLTIDEINQLDNEANRLSDKYNMDIVIVTTNDTQGKSSREFADDYFDYGGFGRGSDYDGILFLLDMDNREAYISTTGIGIRYLTDQRIESVLDSVFDGGLSSGNYYGAISGFLERTEFYLEQGIPSDQFNYPEDPVPNTLTSGEVFLSIIAGVTAGGIFYFVNKSRYKTRRQPVSYSYRANSIVNFSIKDDKLINTYVTHRIIPRNNNPSGGSSSGRSTTHRSSSGRTHGGGGRKF